ncbi:outer membrane beta-barrel protein [Lysobacter cavernae]|uniref:Outer membrane beta-barrel protein n=1 Tax=Lysobacter cavernae TaxID=1685901 RepID=A0ABV7RT39_9GAMM
MHKQLGLALALAVAPLAASAGEISYSYIEGGYAQLNQKLPDVAVDGDLARIDDIEAGGFFIAGSAELGESFHLFGGYKSGSDDVGVTILGIGGGSADVDMSQLNLGLGYHHGLSERADLLTEISYLGTEVDVEGENNEGDDARLAIGVRGLLADSLEGWIKGHYTDGDVYDGEFGATVGAQYKFSPAWGISGEAELVDDTSLFTVGLRASF